MSCPDFEGSTVGRAEARKWFAEAFGEAWESVHNEIVEITEGSDGRIVVELFGTAHGRASGVKTELRP